MTLTERFTGTNDTYAGKVAYRYCLSCDSVLSERIEYSPTVSTTITSWKLYEYDGLNLLRMDERYDNTAGGAISDQDPWRTLEVSTHKPGSLGALIGKRVYTHTNNDATPDATNDYTYTYDAVGNVLAVYNANVTNRGNELYYFTQDAFGNELAPSIFAGSSWSTARPAGITEHQSGKWIDPFSGLYFFHARWYDPVVGRFVGRDPLKPILPLESILQASCTNCRFPEKTKRPFLENPGLFSQYGFCQQNPVIQTDPDGQGIIAILLLANQIINCALCVWDIYLVAQCLSDRAELAEQIHNSSLPNEKQDELLKGIFNDCFSLIESDVLQSAGKCFVATLTRYLGWMTKDMLPPSLQEYF